MNRQQGLMMNIFTVYRTDAGVELHPGCEDYPNRHAIYSARSYEAAYHFAQMAANIRGAVMRDYSQPTPTLLPS